MDPFERAPIDLQAAGSEKNKFKQIEKLAHQFMIKTQEAIPNPAKLNSEAVKELRSLGYIE